MHIFREFQVQVPHDQKKLIESASKFRSGNVAIYKPILQDPISSAICLTLLNIDVHFVKEICSSSIQTKSLAILCCDVLEVTCNVT